MKTRLMKEVQNLPNIVKVEAGFEKPTDIVGSCTATDLYSLKSKLDTALSHFIDEYDWTCSHLKLIAEATVCWHYCHRNNSLRYDDDNKKYLSNYAKKFYEELKTLSASECGENYSNSNKLSIRVEYNNGDETYMYFLTEKMFKLIISMTNEVVINTINDGSNIQNLYDLNEFLKQAIPNWEYMKKTPNVFVPVV